MSSSMTPMSLPSRILRKLSSLFSAFFCRKPYSLDDATRYWAQVPTANYKIDSTKMALQDEKALVHDWDAGLNDYLEGWKARGYLPYLNRYAEMFRGKTLLELGCGLGFEHIHFFSPVIERSFLCDIVPSNVAVVNTVLSKKGVKNSVGMVIDYNDPPPIPPLDFIYSHGVLHHIPFEICKTKTIPFFERYLKKGGKFVIMMYTDDLYRHVKAVNLTDFARKTEAFTPGLHNPWSEPYDLEKVKKLFGDKFKVVYESKYNGDNFALYELEMTSD